MICVSIIGPTFQEVIDQIEQAMQIADIAELRLDCILDPFFNYTEITERYPFPFIITFPNGDGVFRKRIIRAYHNYEEVPKDLSKIEKSLRKKGGDFFKIACRTNSPEDTLKLLLYGKGKQDVIMVPMGERSAFGRILALSMGAPWTYAKLQNETQTASGQLFASEMRRLFYLGRTEEIYGVIGDPLTKSPGEEFHNAYMKQEKKVYVKVPVKENELEGFLKIAPSVFKGLSVTIPHKEKIDPTCAINTISFEKGFVNTDGPAACDLIEEVLSIRQKKIAILGAGGTARGIACEAKKRGAQILILNRSQERGKRLTNLCDGTYYPLGHKLDCPIWINTTGNPNLLPTPQEIIRVALDVSLSPLETPFLASSRKGGATTYNGHDLYKRQAALQRSFWQTVPK